MNKVGRKNAWNRHSLLELSANAPKYTEMLKKSLKGTSVVKPNFFFLTQETNNKIFNPEQRLIFLWKTLTVFFILIQAALVPVILSFPYEYTEDLIQIESAVSGFLLVDILIKLNTGIYRQGHLDTNRKSIFLNVFKKTFVLDVYSALPFAYISRNFPIFLYFLFPKLLKVKEVYWFFDTVQMVLKNLTFMKIFYYFKIFVTVLLCVHWLACVWFYIGNFDLSNQYDSWVIAEGCFGLWAIFIKCVYYVLTSVSTLGYGDITPVGTNELIVSLIILFIGVIIFSFNITSIIDLVIESRQKIIQYQDKMINLNIYMKQKELPKFVKFKLRKYLEYTYNTEKTTIPENQILSLLSDPLREEIFGYTAGGKLIKKCKIFLQLYDGKIIQKLSKFFYSKIFSALDVILEQGENSAQIYFVLYGNVEVFHSQTKSVFKVLGEGDFFGEIGFFTKKPRTATIRCLSILECLVLKREDLDNILIKFPLAAQKTEKIEKFCIDSNYSILNISCYLCNGFGHIACNCEFSRISPDQMNIPQTWVNDQKKSKKVNPRTYIRHNIHHIKKNHPGFKSAEIYKKKNQNHIKEEVFSKVHQKEANNKESVESENNYLAGIQKILTSEEEEVRRVNYTETNTRKYRFSILRSHGDDLLVDEII